MIFFNARSRTAILLAAVVLSILGASLAFASALPPARTIPSQTGETFCAVADARVVEHDENMNRGTGDFFEVDKPDTRGNLHMYSYIKFDLSGLPAGATISSAALHLKVVSGGDGTQHQVLIHSTSSAWEETTITWANQPGRGAQVGALPFPLAPADDVSASISTSTVSGPGVYSFVLAYPDADTHSDGISFVSREGDPAGLGPCLTLGYTIAATPPTATDIPGAPGGLTQIPPTPGAPTQVPPTPQPTPSGPVYSAEDHRRAQAPLCMDLSGQTSPAVRAGVPDGAVPGGNVYCRVLARDGVFPNPADPGRVGDPGLITYGVITAVDVFGVTSNGFADPTFEHAVTVCLEGSGRFIFLSALNSPRTTFELASFSDGGYTCAPIASAGTVVLIPPQPLN